MTILPIRISGLSWLLCLAALAAVLLLQPPEASAQVACPFQHSWSATNPPVNQNHVSCGEWGGSRPKGFHSRPGGVDPATVDGVRNVSAPNPVGIYDLEWWYVGHPGTWKGSTMYPDSCSQQQVLSSILYAANNPVACAPAVPWGSCGMNRPDPVPPGSDYCIGAAGAAQWQIRFATIQVGGQTRVNTAFPNR